MHAPQVTWLRDDGTAEQFLSLLSLMGDVILIASQARGALHHRLH